MFKKYADTVKTFVKEHKVELALVAGVAFGSVAMAVLAQRKIEGLKLEEILTTVNDDDVNVQLFFKDGCYIHHVWSLKELQETAAEVAAELSEAAMDVAA